MTRKTLSSDVAKNFFGALYEEPTELPPEEFDALATRIVARTRNNTLVGDQALQSLLVNFVLSNANDLNQVRDLSSALAGIKQVAVENVLTAFPNANLNELVAAAKSSGYDVQILG